METAGEMEFRQYPEIENHYHKLGQAILDKHASAELWVATEKIHGTNFSFLYDGNTETVSFGRRNGLLTLRDSFFNFQSSIVAKHSAKIPRVFELVKQTIAQVQRIQVFGEFYGGCYPNSKSAKGVKAIQTSIVYTPELEFEAFDLFYDTIDEKDKVLNYKEACRIFQAAELPFAEIIKEGTLQELMQSLDPETYESQIYRKHQLEKVAGNFAEGFVLKPADALFVTDESGERSRVCIKFKNSKHLESGAIPTVKTAKTTEAKKPEATLTEDDEAIISKVLSYANKARFDNVVSKLTEDERNEKKIVGLLMADVWKDFGKAETKETVDKANKLKTKIMPQMRNEIVALIASELQR